MNRRFLGCWRLWLPGIILLSLYGVQVRLGLWGGDFWEHGAAVRAMLLDPLSPAHPLLAVEAPHFFFSPYTLAWALVARWTGAGVIAALAAAGAVNLLLLLGGTWRLIRRAGFARPAAVFGYTLACWIFLWGHDAWQYSGFFHFGVLFQVLPYPSSFAIGVSLWIIAAWRPQTSSRRLAVLGFLAAVVLLSHPLTFLLLCAGLAGFAFCGYRETRDLVGVVAIPVVAVALGLCWPYFPLWRLLPGTGGAAREYEVANQVLYSGVLSRTWPVWGALPLVLTGAWPRRSGRLAVLVAVGLLLAVWGYGWLAGRAVLGRSIAWIIMLLQLLIAERLAACEAAARSPANAARWRCAAGAVLVLVLVTGLGASRALVLGRLDLWRQAPAPLHRQVSAALAGEPVGSIVLADRHTASLLGTFGMKTVCGRFPQPFVPDFEDRQRAVTRLFAGEADAAEWEAALVRWDVTHVLVNRERAVAPPELEQRKVRVLSDNGWLLLLRLDQEGS